MVDRIVLAVGVLFLTAGVSDRFGPGWGMVVLGLCLVAWALFNDWMV